MNFQTRMRKVCRVRQRSGMTPERYVDWVPDAEAADDELARPYRSAAHLTILSDSASANELAQMVGLAPDESWSKGDRASQLVRRTHPHNGNSYGSGLPESQPSAKHLAALIARIEPFLQNVAATAGDPSVLAATVWVVEHTEGDMTDIAAGPEELRALAAMGVAVVASSHFYPEYNDD